VFPLDSENPGRELWGTPPIKKHTPARVGKPVEATLEAERGVARPAVDDDDWDHGGVVPQEVGVEVEAANGRGVVGVLARQVLACAWWYCWKHTRK